MLLNLEWISRRVKPNFPIDLHFAASFFVRKKNKHYFKSLFNPCDILAHGNRHRQIDFRYQCLDKLTCEFGSRQLKKWSVSESDTYRDAVSYFNQTSIIKLYNNQTQKYAAS